MKINGFQKLTLLDYPGKVACTLFAPNCNLRCPFCHNASLVINPEEYDSYSEEEIFGYLKKRRGVIEGVCVSGGEPLLQPDIGEFIAKIRELGYSVKLDTNGTLPEKLGALISSGNVAYVAMDIKNSRENYYKAVGVKDFDTENVEKSASLLMKGQVPFEFRTTLVKGIHTDADIVSIGEWLGGDENYFLQAFKDSGNLISSEYGGFNENEYGHLLTIAEKYFPNVKLRGI